MNLIERLKAAMDSQYIQENTDEVIELLVEVKAEIERLKDLKSFEKELERLCNVSTVRAEAYKEVWEVLRNKCDAPHWCVWLSENDEFFKKLVGESNG